jgi:dihydrofolate reductase
MTTTSHLGPFANCMKIVVGGEKKITFPPIQKAMRKLILNMQVSLDGYIEGPNGDMSWIKTDDVEQWDDLFDMLENVDLLLLGRVMFPEYRDYWKNALTDPKASANEVRYAQFAAKTPHIVFSNRMQNPDWSNSTVVRGHLNTEIKKLKSQSGKDIQVVGGARLAASVIEGGLVDEYRFTVNPSLLGGGKSLFQQQHSRHSLELISTKTLSSGRLIVRFHEKLLVPKSFHRVGSSNPIGSQHHDH